MYSNYMQSTIYQGTGNEDVLSRYLWEGLCYLVGSGIGICPALFPYGKVLFQQDYACTYQQPKKARRHIFTRFGAERSMGITTGLITENAGVSFFT